MSDITSVLSGLINLRRNTPFVVDEVAVGASVSIDRSPPKSSRLEVEIIGATITTGVVNLSGNVDETLNFTENGVQVGTSDFTSLTGLTMSGISDGFIKVRTLNKMGQPLNQEITVESNMAVKFYAQDGRIRMLKQGKEKIAKYKIMAEPDADVQENDLLYAVSGVFGMTFGQISFSEKLFDFDGVTHHTEAEVMDL